MRELLIVTPTLGTAETLGETVRSCMTHAPEARHVLCCPASRVETLSRQFPGCEVVSEPSDSRGVYGALNHAIARYIAHADLWTYLNDDDSLLPGFETVRAEAEKSGSMRITYGSVCLCDAQGRPVTEIQVARRGWQVGHFYNVGKVPFTQQGTIITADLFRLLVGFNTQYKLVADTDFFRRAADCGAHFQYVDAVSAKYMLRRDQLSANAVLQDSERRLMHDLNRFYATAMLSRCVVLWSMLQNRQVLWRRYRRNGTIKIKEIVERAQNA